MDQKNLKPLKYKGYAIVCEEVPDEVSLAFNISGCEHHCDGCHSKYLWEYKGSLLGRDIENILPKYQDLITCVCFLGGDYNIEELYDLCKLIKTKYKLKTCIYSGFLVIDFFDKIIEDGYLDYIKLGRYMSEYGGLNNPNTNQIMYKIISNNFDTAINITEKFWRKY